MRSEIEQKPDKRLMQIAKKAKNDFYFFTKYILNYEKMEKIPHQELCDFVTNPNGKRKKLILLPRGSFKSSVVTVAYSMYSLIQNPNLRILISGESQKNSKKFIKEIRTQYENNEKFKAIFGDWTNKDSTWRDDELYVSKRKIVKKEPSLAAGSLERANVVGQHYDMIILDDAVSPQNTSTPDQMQKTLDYYRLLLSILEPGGQLVIIGTRYCAGDLYGTLMEKENPDHNQFDFLVREAISDDGTLYFPQVLNEEFLEEQKKAQGPYLFSCQYLNRPVSDDTCYFKMEWVKFFDKEPEGSVYFISLDPAISKGERSDYTAIIVNAVDWMNNYYIVEAINEKLAPSEIISKLFSLYETYSPMAIGMEKHMLEQTLMAGIQSEGNKRGVALPIVQIPTDTRVSKERRIMALQPKFEQGHVYIRKSQKELYHQIVYYPLGTKHDDLLDSLKTQLQITFPSSHKPEETKLAYQDINPNLSPEDRERWQKDMKSISKPRYVKRSYRI